MVRLPRFDRHPMSRVAGVDVSSVLRIAFLRLLALHAARALGAALRGSSFQKPSVRPLRVPITTAVLGPTETGARGFDEGWSASHRLSRRPRNTDAVARPRDRRRAR